MSGNDMKSEHGCAAYEATHNHDCCCLCQVSSIAAVICVVVISHIIRLFCVRVYQTKPTAVVLCKRTMPNKQRFIEGLLTVYYTAVYENQFIAVTSSNHRSIL